MNEFLLLPVSFSKKSLFASGSQYSAMKHTSNPSGRNFCESTCMFGVSKQWYHTKDEMYSSTVARSPLEQDATMLFP